MPLELFLTKTQKKLGSQEVTYVRIKVISGARKNEFAEVLEGEEQTLKVKIKALPEKGKANAEIVKFFAKYFQANCKIVSGGQNAIKLLKLSR